jgi:hypothetical protein
MAPITWGRKVPRSPHAPARSDVAALTRDLKPAAGSGWDPVLLIGLDLAFRGPPVKMST